ncbi:unnamed protein product [Fusarium venenatum]|uniref:Uncharacterized protein n=1 Tax=Fusarium venenatum TaxID=56646 RepID=A0A2L2TVC6_9HYPO|nr:uncharacterized protein FVRRES_08353 [Fusarium venenatum]CEI68276.1 unnamed protein product [Fusarium venenatum]
MCQLTTTAMICEICRRLVTYTFTISLCRSEKCIQQDVQDNSNSPSRELEANHKTESKLCISMEA